MKEIIWYRHGDLVHGSIKEDKTWYCAKCDVFENEDHFFEKHIENIKRSKSDHKWYLRHYKPKGVKTGKDNLFI